MMSVERNDSVYHRLPQKFACHHLVAVVDRDGEDRLADHPLWKTGRGDVFISLNIRKIGESSLIFGLNFEYRVLTG